MTEHPTAEELRAIEWEYQIPDESVVFGWLRPLADALDELERLRGVNERRAEDYQQEAARGVAAEKEVERLRAFERLIRASYLPDEEADALMAQAEVEANKEASPDD